MATPSPIGIWVNVSSVWKRVEPPHIRVSGVWKEVTGVWVKASGVWKRCYANIDGEIEVSNLQIFVFDTGSPFDSTAGLRWNGDGTIDKQDKPPDAGWVDNTSQWRLFDMGRDYEIRFRYSSGDHVDTEPTLNTWLDLTDPSTTHTLLHNKTNLGVEEGIYNVDVREKITAPAGGNDTGTATLKIDNDPGI